MCCGTFALALDLFDDEGEGGGGIRTAGLFESPGGGDNEIKSLAWGTFGDGGGMSMTSLESIKVGGLCSSRHSATCHIPTAVRGVDGGEKNVSDHIRPREGHMSREELEMRRGGASYLVQ